MRLEALAGLRAAFGVLIAGFLLVMAPASARAGDVPIALRALGVDVAIPGSWEGETLGDELLVGDPGGEAMMTFRSFGGLKVDDAFDEIRHAIGGVLQHVQLSPSEQRILGGMPAMMSDGIALLGEDAVDVGVVLARTPAKRWLMVLGIAQSDQPESRRRKMHGILKSLRAVDARGRPRAVDRVSSPKKGWDRVQLHALRLEIDVPTRWALKSGKGERAVRFDAPGGGGVRIEHRFGALDRGVVRAALEEQAASASWTIERIRDAGKAAAGRDGADIVLEAGAKTKEGPVSIRVHVVLAAGDQFTLTFAVPEKRARASDWDRIARSARPR